MDEMKIKSKFLKGIITSVLKKQMKKKSMIDADIELGDISFKQEEGVITIELNSIKLKTHSCEISNLLKGIGVI